MVHSAPDTGGYDMQLAVPTIACGTPDASGATVATTLVCFLPFAHGAADALAHPAFRAPSFEGGTKESFGRPRAVITTGVMAHICKCELFEKVDRRWAILSSPSPFSGEGGKL